MPSEPEPVPIKEEDDFSGRDMRKLRTNLSWVEYWAERDKVVSINTLSGIWYRFVPSRFQMFYALRNRESVFMKELDDRILVMRPFKVYSTDSLNYHFKVMKVYTHEFKIYNSIFTIDWDKIGRPPTNLYHVDEWKAFRDEFKEKWEDAKTGYDFVLDIDGNVPANGLKSAFSLSKKWTTRVHEFLEEKGIDHIVNFSGRNFHIRIPQTFVDIPWKEYYSMAEPLAKSIAKATKVPYGKGQGIDSSIYDARRIIKTLYSASDGRVILPVTNKQLEEFELEDYDIVNILNNVRIKHRDVSFKYGLDTSELLRKMV